MTRAPLKAVPALLLLAFLAPLRAQAPRSYPRFFIGPLFDALRTYQPTNQPFQFCQCFFNGAGLVLGYNLNKLVAVEIEGGYFPVQGGSSFSQIFHKLSTAEFFAGLRPGFRWRRLGLFYKFRVGVLTWGNAFNIAGFNSAGISEFGLGRQTSFATDQGAVIECYLSRPWALRLEIGDTELYTNNPSQPGANPILPPYVPSGTYNNLEIRAGIIWRVW
ncbi:MAG: hypothetical protein ACRD2F_03965 [Terriglobales bacterium]